MRRANEVTVVKRENGSCNDADERIAPAGNVHQRSIGIVRRDRTQSIHSRKVVC